MLRKNFFCYSKRMFHFLSFMNLRYISVGINKNSNQKYWVYKKSKDLDQAIELYNSLKYKL